MQAHPERFLYDSAIMTIDLMDETLRADIEELVCLCEACASPMHCPAPFREEDVCNGYLEEMSTSYRLAKRMLLGKPQAYRQGYGSNAISLLPVSYRGLGDSFDDERPHVGPALARKGIEPKRHGHDSIAVSETGDATVEVLCVE